MGHAQKRTPSASESTLSSVIAISTEMLISEKQEYTSIKWFISAQAHTRKPC